LLRLPERNVSRFMNDTVRTIHGLRSNRKFTSEEIPKETLGEILEACVKAANASARQSYSIVVVGDREVIKETLGYEGSRALIFCVDYNRIVDAAEHLGYNFTMSGINAFITGSTDAVLAAQTAAIAAKSLGIDSLFTNSLHRGDIDRIYKRFGLPERYCFPLISLILGYSAETPEYSKGRLEGKGVIHYDGYHRLTAEELDWLVDEYDDPEKRLGVIRDWEERGFAHYLDWFYAVWSVRNKRSVPESVKQLFDILRRAGFMEGFPL
jgi:FMN reductase [NAD(P)H]